MHSTRQIEALAHGCAVCGKSFQDGTFVCNAYAKKDLRSFEKQIELGIIGQGVRSLWIHTSCKHPDIRSWNVVPDIHTCVRCKKAFSSKDVIQPVFQIVNPRAQNPSDPTDVGIELGDRVYFMHADCENTQLNRTSGNILLV